MGSWRRFFFVLLGLLSSSVSPALAPSKVTGICAFILGTRTAVPTELALLQHDPEQVVAEIVVKGGSRYYYLRAVRDWLQYQQERGLDDEPRRGPLAWLSQYCRHASSHCVLNPKSYVHRASLWAATLLWKAGRTLSNIRTLDFWFESRLSELDSRDFADRSVVWRRSVWGGGRNLLSVGPDDPFALQEGRWGPKSRQDGGLLEALHRLQPNSLGMHFYVGNGDEGSELRIRLIARK